MSILTKPYEIAIYEDQLQSGQFVERRLAVIGTNEMNSQNRALEPTLVRNVSGQNSFSFKMYKKYVDNVTGETVINPFSDWLVNERKVKLKYGTYIDSNGIEKDKWYDFIIKDVAENSSNYLYTYQLEDALVQELSKNGFGKTLDTELNNNVGTAKELAKFVLKETDWTVESEVFVQKVEEALIYVTFPYGTIAKRIIDQTDLQNGISVEDKIFSRPSGEASSARARALAFYSSCNSKPHRFQFIYLDSYEKDDISIDENRIITEPNCQYYIDFDFPEETYKDSGSYWLPNGWAIESASGSLDDSTDSTISTWYRGKRYGFAQQSEYIPMLDKYCGKYTKYKTVNSTFSAASNEAEYSFDINSGKHILTVTPSAEQYTGLKMDCDNFEDGKRYKLTYIISNIGTISDSAHLKMTTIGGHSSDEVYTDKLLKINGVIVQSGNGSYSNPYPIKEEEEEGNKIVQFYFTYNQKEVDNPALYIQPNRGQNYSEKPETSTSVYISDISIVEIEEDSTEQYYGYDNSEYKSPVAVLDAITNSEFKTTTGWTGSYFGVTENGNSKFAPKLEAMYGKFRDGEFHDVIKELQDNTYSETENYYPLLKASFTPFKQTDHESIIINSGFYDNRTMIGEVDYDEQWFLKVEILDKSGNKISDPLSKFTFCLREVLYNSKRGNYSKGDIWAETDGAINNDIVIMKFNSSTFDKNHADVKLSKENFAKKEIKLIITPKDGAVPSQETQVIYYIKTISLYKKYKNAENEWMVPGEIETEGMVIPRTTFFSKTNLKNSTAEDQLVLTHIEKVNHGVYQPVYNSNAEKVRTITAKESNYFNILQNIAETFEAWLSLEAERDGTGAITKKTARYKNYAGKENYASFKYGVNLKDISRTYTSKDIVTKLIVKQNSNEYAKDGFCTIAKSSHNPTGENYIYDFQYYDNIGLLNARDYLDLVYDKTGATGPDLGAGHETEAYNLQGYFPRLKDLNNQIISLNEDIIDLNAELVELEARKTVAENTVSAARSGLVQINEDFYTLSEGILPSQISENDYASIECEVIGASESSTDVANSNQLNEGNDWAQDAAIIVQQVPPNDSNSRNFKFSVSLKDEVLSDPYDKDQLEFAVYDEIDGGSVTWTSSSGELKRNKNSNEWGGISIQKINSSGYSSGFRYRLTYTIEGNSALQTIGGHCSSFSGYSIKVYKNPDAEKELIASTTSDYVNLPPFTDDDIINPPIFYVMVEGTYYENGEDSQPYLFIQPNRGVRGDGVNDLTFYISNIQVYVYEENRVSRDRTFKFQPIFTLTQYDPEQKNLLANPEYEILKSNQDSTAKEESLYIIAQQDLNELIGKSLTFSYYLERPENSGTSNSNAPDWGENRFGIHGCALWEKEGSTETTVTYPFAAELETTSEGERVSMETILTPPSGYSSLKSFRFAVQPFAIPNAGITWKMNQPQLAFTTNEKVSDYNPITFESPSPGSAVCKKPILACTIPAFATAGTLDYTMSIVDLENTKLHDLLIQYATYEAELTKALNELNSETRARVSEEDESPVVFSKGLIDVILDKKIAIASKEGERDKLLEHKEKLNQKFFSLYSNFIQEGTWIDEEYVDDDKYYADAQSVMYNSCYPKVAYAINVLELSRLPGYELFTFDLGDQTYAEDPDFFGTQKKEKVVITELSERLDDPSKNQIRVQNFKNQFQDLFQRITATVQQAQYSTGAYEKAAALAEASAQKKEEFVSAALGLANAKFSAAGQTSVVQDINGLTLTDERTQDQMRLIGGAILMGTTDKETGVRSWKTGLTPEGISASLVTAGTINTGNIQITNGSDPVFRWDTFGISAFDADWNNGQIISRANPYKFVRFDKHGIYGINGVVEDNTSVNGESWKPNDINEIDAKATFALTWEGLKVTGSNGVEARIGKITQNGTEYIMNITKGAGDDKESLLSFSNNGTLKVGDWSVSKDGLDSIDEESATYDLRRSAVSSIPQVFLSAKGRQILSDPDNPNPWGDADIVFKAGDHFHVTKQGAVYGSAGNIAGWEIEEDGLVSANKNVVLNADNKLQFALWEQDWVYTSTDGPGGIVFCSAKPTIVSETFTVDIDTTSTNPTIISWDKEIDAYEILEIAKPTGISSEEWESCGVKGNIELFGKCALCSYGYDMDVIGDFTAKLTIKFYHGYRLTISDKGIIDAERIRSKSLSLKGRGVDEHLITGFLAADGLAFNYSDDYTDYEALVYPKQTRYELSGIYPCTNRIADEFTYTIQTCNQDGFTFSQKGTIQLKAGKIILCENDKTVNVGDLVFKGPYDIKHNGNVVGSICQIGPVVYGKLFKQDDPIDASVKTLDIEYGTTSSVIPGPTYWVNTCWLVNQYDDGGGFEVAHLACCNRDGNLSLEIGSISNGVWSGGADWRFDTYFCYCINSAHQLPKGTEWEI